MQPSLSTAGSVAGSVTTATTKKIDEAGSESGSTGSRRRPVFKRAASVSELVQDSKKSIAMSHRDSTLSDSTDPKSPASPDEHTEGDEVTAWYPPLLPSTATTGHACVHMHALSPRSPICSPTQQLIYLQDQVCEGNLG